jgi:hypothetical protein
MNTEQFQDLLDRHGADFMRWPPDQRAQAKQLVADSAEARATLKQAQQFDAALSRVVDRQSADDAAVMRVVARLNARPLPRQKVPLWRLPAMLLDFRITPALPRVAALCACAVIGFFVGLSAIDYRMNALERAEQSDPFFLSPGGDDLGTVFGLDIQSESRL